MTTKNQTPAVEAEDVLMKTREVAKRLGLTSRTLDNWRKSTRNGVPKGPKFAIISIHTIRYRLSDVREWEAKMAASSGAGEI